MGINYLFLMSKGNNVAPSLHFGGDNPPSDWHAKTGLWAGVFQQSWRIDQNFDGGDVIGWCCGGGMPCEDQNQDTFCPEPLFPAETEYRCGWSIADGHTFMGGWEHAQFNCTPLCPSGSDKDCYGGGWCYSVPKLQNCD